MITIAEAVKEIVKNSPLLDEGISMGIINYSSLARSIKPQIEEKVFKTVQVGAIVMALKRFSKNVTFKSSQVKHIFEKDPDMIVRSHLVEYTIANSATLIEKHRMFFNKVGHEHKYFFIITQGVFETAMIISSELKTLVDQNFKDEKIISQMEGLSSITIQLPPENVTTPGLYGHILKALGWEGINVIDVSSTATEFTLILKDQDVDRAFSALKKLFRS
jgi:hypothetical protein